MDEIYEMSVISRKFWEIFKDLAKEAGTDDKDQLMDKALKVFRDKSEEYKGRTVFNYAVNYAVDLVYEIERMLYYPGRCKFTNYMDVRRFNSDDFEVYRKDPNPRDVITEVRPDGVQVRWKVEAVILPEMEAAG